MSTSDKPLVPYDWQQADIDKLIDGITPQAGALIVSAPGAGKTVVAVEVLRALSPEGANLIIAPPNTKRGWDRTLLRQGMTGVRKLIGTAAGKRAFEDLKWGVPGNYLASAQWMARQNWKGITPDAVVFDEVHIAGAYGNVTQKKLHTLVSPIRIAMSGTPLRNKFENAWSIVRWVEPAKMPKEYWVWRMTDCEWKYSKFAPQNAEVTGEKEPGKLIGSLTNYIIHHQRTECCDFHPNGFMAGLEEPVVIERLVPMTPAQTKFYREIEHNMFTLLETPGPDGKLPVIAELPITARSMLRFCALGLPSLDVETEKLYFEENCESPKLDALIFDLYGLDGKRALVLTHSNKFARVTTKRLQAAGFRTEMWGGGLSDTRRGKILDGFTEGSIDVIVGVISAMGTGTDGLQEAAYNVMWLSIDEDGTNNDQGIGRLDRLGQKHRVNMFYYLSDGTFDVGLLDKQIVKRLKLNESLRIEKK